MAGVVKRVGSSPREEGARLPGPLAGGEAGVFALSVGNRFLRRRPSLGAERVALALAEGKLGGGPARQGPQAVGVRRRYSKRRRTDDLHSVDRSRYRNRHCPPTCMKIGIQPQPICSLERVCRRPFRELDGVGSETDDGNS